jgi:precorrin-3B synthase
MTAPLVQGWCPGALRPMASGDGLVVRVRAHGGRLSRDQARIIADLAQVHGNGLIDLSARANLQLRGIREANHGAVLAGLDSLGLIDSDAATEARRNILVTPFWQTGDGTQDLAMALERALTEDLPLPGKFGFALDTGSEAVLRGSSADIRIERVRGKLYLRADGSDLAQTISPKAAVPAALDLARWFLNTGGAVQGRGRMAAHLARGVALPPGFDTPVDTPAFLPRPGAAPSGAVVALPFGQMDAATLRALADLAPLRLTPWRMLLLEGVEACPALPGVITDPLDPTLRVAACTGAPGCTQALAPVRDLARDLAPHVPMGRMLHISACAKGCAHPGPADITLTARHDGFAIAHNATARDAANPVFAHAQLLADPSLLTART